MSLDIIQLAILRRVFQVEPKFSRGGVMVTPSASTQEPAVHYIRITPDQDDRFVIDFITRKGKDAMASGYFHEGDFYIAEHVISGWHSIDRLVDVLPRITW
jgi:hypothetical protein